MSKTRVQIIAETLCECDGKNWLEIVPAERDRYFRIALMISYRIERQTWDDIDFILPSEIVVENVL